MQEFAKSTECDETNNRLNVIPLPDQDLKHFNKNSQTQQEEEKVFTEQSESNISNENLFTNQDGLILLIQGGCKRWKDMFGSYITDWIMDKDKEYRKQILLCEIYTVKLRNFSKNFCGFIHSTRIFKGKSIIHIISFVTLHLL